MKRNDLIGSLEKLGWYLEVETFGRAWYDDTSPAEQWRVAAHKIVPVPSTPRVRVEDIQANACTVDAALAVARERLLARVREWEDLA